MLLCGSYSLLLGINVASLIQLQLIVMAPTIHSECLGYYILKKPVVCALSFHKSIFSWGWHVQILSSRNQVLIIPNKNNSLNIIWISTVLKLFFYPKMIRY